MEEKIKEAVDIEAQHHKVRGKVYNFFLVKNPQSFCPQMFFVINHENRKHHGLYFGLPVKQHYEKVIETTS